MPIDAPDVDVRGRVTTGVLWSVLQRWSVRMSTMLTFIILGRLLEPEEFGIVAVATALVGIVNVFSEVGFGTYVIQHRDLTEREISTVFWSSVALSLGLAVVLATVSAPIAGVLGQPELGPVLLALSALILLTSLTSLPTALLKRELHFKVIAVRAVIATTVSCAVAIVLAVMGAGVWSLVAQSLVYAVVSIAVLWTATAWRPSRSYDMATARTAVRYGSSVLGIQVLAQLRQRADVLVISAIAGPVVVGYYTIATRIMSTVLDTAVSVISTVASPVFARLKDDRPRLRRAYTSAVCTSLAVTAPLLLLIAVTADIAIPAVFGVKWAPSVVVAQVLTVSGLVSTIVYFDRGLMIAVDRRRTELLISLATTLGGVALVAVVAPAGLLAISIAVAIRAAVSWPFRIRLSSRVLGMAPWPHTGRMVLIMLAAALSSVPGVVSVLAIGEDAAVAAVGIAVGGMALLYPVLLRFASPVAWRELSRLARRTRFRKRSRRASAGSLVASEGAREERTI